MKDLILFSIDKNNFALELDKIKRIVQATETTPIAGNAEEIEGVFTFEGNILNVLDFRCMIGVDTFTMRYEKTFTDLKAYNEDFSKRVLAAKDNDEAFEGSLSAHDCPLGKWLSSFQAYDNFIGELLKSLSTAHSEFHACAADILNSSHDSNVSEQKALEERLLLLKEKISAHLDSLNESKHILANSMQKFLIIDATKSFAVRIDEVDDIIAISEEDIQSSDSFEEDDSLVKINGIFEYKQKLVNLIGVIAMPARKE